MPSLAAAAATAISIIAGAAAAAASAVAAIGSAIAAVASSVASAIAATASAIAAAISTTVAAIASSVSAAVGSIITEIGSALTYVGSNLGAAANAVFTAAKTFAEAIHLKTIIAVHRIAYFASEDYRQMMNEVFRKIRNASEAMGLGPYFINLALQNARTIVLDVSAMMGRKFDLGNVVWFKTMKGWMEVLEEKAEHYIQEPGALIEDIFDIILKDTINAGASEQQGLFKWVEGAAKVINNTVKDLDTIRKDLMKLINDLPKEIREEIYDEIGGVIHDVNDFFEEDFPRYKDHVYGIIEAINGDQNSLQSRVGGIVDRISKPGDLLEGVDALDSWDRRRQEEKINDVANRQSWRESDELAGEAEHSFQRLARLADALEREFEPPDYHVPEQKKPTQPPGEQSSGPDTWYVGDY
jgi:hypothetical protein